MPKYIQSWEASMWSAVRTAVSGSRHDVKNLYLKLERMSKDLFEQKKIKEGSSFRVPLETGQIMEISFFRQYSTVNMIQPDGRVSVAISESDSYKKEYRYLEATTDALKASGFGIGPKAPKEFHRVLSDAKTGDVFVFEDGHSYVCSLKFGNYKEFKKTCERTKAPQFSDIEYSEGFAVRSDKPLDVQEIYRTLKDPYTWDIKTKITSIDNARLILNRLFSNPEETKAITLGPNKLIAQKNRTGRGLVYFNEKGEQISEQKALLMLAWLEANPNRTEINRYKPTAEEEMNDIVFKRGLDELASAGKHKEVFEYIAGYCKKYGKNLEITMSSYTNDGKAVSWIFKSDDTRVYRAVYENNDLSGNIEKIEPADIKDFIIYCREKYDKDYLYIKNSVIEDCHKRFPEWKGIMYEQVMDTVTAKKMTEKPPPTKVRNLSEDDGILITLMDFEDLD